MLMYQNALKLSFALIFLLSTLSNASAADNIEKLDISLSDEVIEAVNSGVEIIIQCDIAHRKSFWFFSTSQQLQSFRYKLQRNALSNQFMVKLDTQSKPKIFRSQLEATNFIAAEAKMLLESGSTKQKPLSMRLFLNRFELPAPMRLNAFLSSAWAINTGWIKWTYVN